MVFLQTPEEELILLGRTSSFSNLTMDYRHASQAWYLVTTKSLQDYSKFFTPSREEREDKDKG